MADVKVDMRAIKKFSTTIRDGLNNPSAVANPIRDTLRFWAVLYRSFTQERFDAFSRGGGDWPSLAAATKRARRSPKNKKTRRSFTILRDTNTLFNALEPVFKRAPGALEQHGPFEVTVGFGGADQHPGGVSVADLASYHHTGAGRLPVRELLVRPPGSVQTQMVQAMRNTLKAMGG